MKKVFIIGTDTEVGKTYISTNLIKAYEAQNIKSICLKPVASGGSHKSDLCEDVENIIDAYEYKFSSNEINMISFREAIAPHIAAAKYDINISLQNLESFIKSKYSKKLDILLVEGAGGLLTPYSNKITQFDLIKLLKIPILLVSSIKVGCINHTLLTINELKRYNVEIIGWIANCNNHNISFKNEQIETIEKFSGYKCISKITHNSSYLNFIELSKILIY